MKIIYDNDPKPGEIPATDVEDTIRRAYEKDQANTYRIALLRHGLNATAVHAIVNGTGKLYRVVPNGIVRYRGNKIVHRPIKDIPHGYFNAWIDLDGNVYQTDQQGHVTRAEELKEEGFIPQGDGNNPRDAESYLKKAGWLTITDDTLNQIPKTQKQVDTLFDLKAAHGRNIEKADGYSIQV